MFGYWDAIEVRASLAFIDGGDIEEQKKRREHPDETDGAYDNRDYFPSTVKLADGDVGQNHERQQIAKNKSKQMRIIVHPRQKPENKQKQENHQEFGKCSPRV